MPLGPGCLYGSTYSPSVVQRGTYTCADTRLPACSPTPLPFGHLLLRRRRRRRRRSPQTPSGELHRIGSLLGVDVPDHAVVGRVP